MENCWKISLLYPLASKIRLKVVWFRYAPGQDFGFSPDRQRRKKQDPLIAHEEPSWNSHGCHQIQWEVQQLLHLQSCCQMISMNFTRKILLSLASLKISLSFS